MKPVPMGRVLPLYLVVFIGFVGYSLMITVFTPLMLADEGGLLPQSSSISERTLVLGLLLALYPLAQFVGSPILGALSDRFGRRRVLLISLATSAGCYALIALALTIRFGVALAVCLAAVVVPHPEGALWVTLAACALALAVCLPSMASMISQAVGAEEQGSALGANQSLQVGAEGLSGLAGGGLAAISTALPLPAMGALALVGSGLLMRSGAKAAVSRTGGRAQPASLG